MVNSKLIAILKSFNPEEWKALGKYFRMHPKKNVTKLYDYLKKGFPDWKDEDLKKEKVFKRVFPGAYYDGKMRNLMSDATKMVENFLISEYYKNEHTSRERLLIEIMGTRNIYHLFQNQTQSLIREIQNKTDRGSAYFLNSYALFSDYYFHPYTNKQASVDSLLASIHGLEHFYQLEKLKLDCELQSREKILSENYSEIDETYQKMEASGNVLLKIYQEIKELYASQDKNLYKKVKDKFLNGLNDISKQDALNVLALLLNFVIGKISEAEKHTLEESFDLYKIGIDKNILVQNNLITTGTFLNITISGSTLKKFDWTYHFIQTYEQFLNKDVREDIKTLATGFWHFFKSEFMEVTEMLGHYHFKQVLIQINARTLLMRTYYELFLDKKQGYNYDFLHAQCEAFDKYIKRNVTINPRRQKLYQNFIVFFRKLLKLSIDQVYRIKHKELILKSLLNAKNVFAKNWLLEKIKAIK